MIITNEFINSLRPCSDRHENYLKHYRNTSFTWLQFLNLKDITTDDKIWVFTRSIAGMEDLQREFSTIVASRAVDKVNIPELNDYFNLVLFMLESGDWSLKDLEEYRAAYSTACGAADWAARWAANEAADYTAYRAAYWAADYAADEAVERAAEREIQLNILKDIIK